MNYSYQREIIYETLKTLKNHPTAEYVYHYLKYKNYKISLATVYRNLNKMAALGKIKKIGGINGSARYDYNINKHYHFECQSCGKIFDISYEFTLGLTEQIQNATGFKIYSHDMIFYGLCAECRDNNYKTITL